MSAKLKVVISAAVAVVCAAVIIITTCVIALSPDGTDDGHVKVEISSGVEVNAGELEISLIREKLETVTLNSNGFPTPYKNESRVDFSQSNENIFGINSNTLIGPSCSFSAQMVISNKKQSSFEYWLEIVPKGGSLLAEQLELTVTVGEEIAVKRTLNDGLQTLPLAKVEDGAESRFNAKLEYLSVSDNNETQNATLAFDMVVHVKLI